MNGKFTSKQLLFNLSRNWCKKNAPCHPSSTQVSTNDLSGYRLQDRTSVEHAEVNEAFFSEMRKRDTHRVLLAEAIYLTLLQGEGATFSLADYRKEKKFENEEDAKRFNAIVGITIRYLLDKSFIAFAENDLGDALPTTYGRGLDFSEWSSYFGSNQKKSETYNEVQ